MFRQLMSLLVLAVSGLGLHAQEAATDNPQIKVDIVTELEVEQRDQDGEVLVTWEPATEALPGSTIVYTLRYANVSKETARDVSLTCDIPKRLSYRNRSARGQGTRILMSVDDGKTFEDPAILTVKGEDGQTVPAGAKDYSHLRWLVLNPLEPGASGAVSFTARLRRQR